MLILNLIWNKTELTTKDTKKAQRTQIFFSVNFVRTFAHSVFKVFTQRAKFN